MASAHLVYVGLDRDGSPAEVAKVIAETDEERRRQAEARVRREQRLLRKRALADALRASEAGSEAGRRCRSAARRLGYDDRAMSEVTAPLTVRDATAPVPTARQHIRFAFYRVRPGVAPAPGHGARRRSRGGGGTGPRHR